MPPSHYIATSTRKASKQADITAQLHCFDYPSENELDDFGEEPLAAIKQVKEQQ